MEGTIKIMVFQIGTQSFGMEIKTLAGLLPAGEDTNISNEKHTNGRKMISVNHTIIPVLDLHDKLRISPVTPIENMLLVSSSGNSKLAVPIDRVEAIYDVPCQNLLPVPPAVQNRENSIFEKIAVHKEQLIPLFDTERLFLLLNRAKELHGIFS